MNSTIDEFLKSQIITYMGNKRKLLDTIGDSIDEVKNEMKKDTVSLCDGFSGSGIVSRLLKTKGNVLYTNDIAGYSKTLNDCYLATPTPTMMKNIQKYIDTANKLADNFESQIENPWISKHWAPQSDKINKSDRAYFTRENARRIDIMRDYIETIPKQYKPFVLAPLLVQASIHNNTNGQFSAYYKDGDVGAFGGKKKIDEKRITGSIRLPYPIFYQNKCNVHTSQSDTNKWTEKKKKNDKCDIVYYDPPYNKHPYNIYYFMLDIINDWDKSLDIPETNRGQPMNWTVSKYNSRVNAKQAMENLIKNTHSSYIILSYNDGGIISIPDLDTLLEKNAAKVIKKPITHKTYNRLKGISNYKRENEYKDVKEFLYIIKK